MGDAQKSVRRGHGAEAGQLEGAPFSGAAAKKAVESAPWHVLTKSAALERARRGKEAEAEQRRQVAKSDFPDCCYEYIQAGTTSLVRANVPLRFRTTSARYVPLASKISEKYH